MRSPRFAAGWFGSGLFALATSLLFVGATALSGRTATRDLVSAAFIGLCVAGGVWLRQSRVRRGP
jgi:hypothetical protein